ncbi:hypothetical protein KEM56_000382 [Ascosphaera pollenicola]|nr:hypothetical protein KEM56_000382 [Ascosphaera pollenicola]
MGVRSENIQTVVATLRLITVIVDRHHIFASSFIKTLDEREVPEAQRCVGALNAEIQQFMALATSIVDEPRLDHMYGNYLADATAVLEIRNMELPLHNKDLLPEHYSKYPLRVDPHDDLLEGIVDLLESFFTNSTVLNLGLTDAISGLASSNLISLDGWLLVNPQNYIYPDPVLPDDDEELTADGALDVDRAIEQLKRVYVQPFWHKKHVPPITKVLRRLVKQIIQWRSEVPDFDILIAARKKLLQEDASIDSNNNNSKRQSLWPTELPFRGLKELKLDTAASSITFTDGGAGVESPTVCSEDGSKTPSRYGSPAGAIVAEDIRKRLNTKFTVKKPRRSTLSAGAARARGLRSRVNTLMSMPSFNAAEHRLEEQKSSSSTTAAEEQKAGEGGGQPPKAEEKEDDGGGGGSGKEEKEITGTNSTTDEQALLAVPPTPTFQEVKPPPSKSQDEESVTLGHVLTNTILLYEFILELSSLIQMRASLFQEVNIQPVTCLPSKSVQIQGLV